MLDVYIKREHPDEWLFPGSDRDQEIKLIPNKAESIIEHTKNKRNIELIEDQIVSGFGEGANIL